MIVVLQSGGAYGKARQFDLVVYGGTAGGVSTAVAAAREDLKVALLEPRRNLGGMVSGGLGETDISRHPEVIGGYSLEFFERESRHYGKDFVRKFNGSINRPHLGDVGWYFEPHVAEHVFREMVQEAGVEVFFNHHLRERNGVLKVGTRITEIRTENGAAFTAPTAPVFADATYEVLLERGSSVICSSFSCIACVEVEARSPLRQEEVAGDAVLPLLPHSGTCNRRH